MTVWDVAHATDAHAAAIGQHRREHRDPSPGPVAEGALCLVATLAAIHAAALGRRFLSYGAVASASGLPWSAARRRMDPHLFDLCRRATARGWPLLSAIVVDQKSVAHGAMRGRPLIGFARAAERCGRIVGGDAAAFLAEEQELVFEWAERERWHDLHP
jgi:drug/metabolite transporter superfamily protein YnfA